MPLTIINHPLAKHYLTRLRDKNTEYTEYRMLSKAMASIMAVLATSDLPTKNISITTPICDTTGEEIVNSIILVPILRAGLSMLDPVQELFQNARVGFIGLQRTSSELEPEQYYLNVPSTDNATVLILDPMIATGGSALTAIKLLKNLNFHDIRIVSFVAAPEGIKLLEQNYPSVPIYTAALDERLNDHNYIVPGLGDFGDRLFGTKIISESTSNKA